MTRSFLSKSLPIAGVAVLAAAQFGCWEGTTADVQATVLALEGPVMINSRAREAFPLTPERHPGKGEIVEMTGASHAALALLPNLLVQLDRSARLEIVELRITKEGNETRAAMQARYAAAKLLSGRMFVSHVWGEAIARLNVTTPHGELSTTSNALFCVESDEHKTRVTCVSGTVGWQPRKAEAVTPIPPGFVLEGSASNSSLVPAETDARWQEELQAGLEAEQRLMALISQRRDALP